MTALQAKMLGASISNRPVKVNEVRAHCCTQPIMRRQRPELEIIEGESIANAKFVFSIKNPLPLFYLQAKVLNCEWIISLAPLSKFNAFGYPQVVVVPLGLITEQRQQSNCE